MDRIRRDGASLDDRSRKSGAFMLVWVAFAGIVVVVVLVGLALLARDRRKDAEHAATLENEKARVRAADRTIARLERDLARLREELAATSAGAPAREPARVDEPSRPVPAFAPLPPPVAPPVVAPLPAPTPPPRPAAEVREPSPRPAPIVVEDLQATTMLAPSSRPGPAAPASEPSPAAPASEPRPAPPASGDDEPEHDLAATTLLRE
jgi:outer membrane biosynthesis protein TonB